MTIGFATLRMLHARRAEAGSTDTTKTPNQLFTPHRARRQGRGRYRRRSHDYRDAA